MIGLFSLNLRRKSLFSYTVKPKIINIFTFLTVQYSMSYHTSNILEKILKSDCVFRVSTTFKSIGSNTLSTECTMPLQALILSFLNLPHCAVISALEPNGN